MDIDFLLRQYLRRLKMEELALEDVMVGLGCFLQPVWDAIVGEEELLKQWNCEKNDWLSGLLDN